MNSSKTGDIGTHLAVVHAPQLDLSIVGAGNDERHRRVKRRPVGASIVTFQNVFDDTVGLAEEVGAAWAFHVVHAARVRGNILLAEA